MPERATVEGLHFPQMMLRVLSDFKKREYSQKVAIPIVIGLNCKLGSLPCVLNDLLQ